MRYTLSREKVGDDLEMHILPERRLSPRNFVHKFKDGNIAANVDFLQYRKFLDEKPQDIIRLQNYKNDQLTCVAQNLDDLSQEVLKVQSHVSGLHSSLDDLSQKYSKHFDKLKDVNMKLEKIMEVVVDLKLSLEKENLDLEEALTAAEVYI